MNEAITHHGADINKTIFCYAFLTNCLLCIHVLTIQPIVMKWYTPLPPNYPILRYNTGQGIFQRDNASKPEGNG